MPRLAPAGQQRQACRALNRVPYLLGEVEIADGREPALTGQLDSVETYNPARYRGGILQLHYARAPELAP